MKWRLLLVSATIFLAFGALIYKIYELQIIKGDFYLARAEAQIFKSGILEPRRGAIFFTDKNGNPVPAALNKEFPTVFASPKQLGDLQEVAYTLAPILGLEPEELLPKLKKPNSSWEFLASKVSAEIAKKIKTANIKGVYLDSQEFRYYPLEQFGAHLLGFVGQSREDEEFKGRYGLEAYFEEYLRGTPGRLSKEEIIEPTHGRNLALTIDRAIQVQAEEILAKTISDNKASGGTIIVSDPKTGKILALANYPSFNPNDYSKSDLGIFLNAAVQTIYEPGSVFKVITMAAGIDAGRLTPETKFVDTGSLTLNGKTIRNYDDKVFGEVTMRAVIENSINTGAAFAVQRTGYDVFKSYVQKFGFEERTGVTLPGEVKGSLKSLRDKRDINFATAAFGQGIAVTPIELMSAISAIGNGGRLLKPQLILGQEPELIRRVIKPETAEAVKQMMMAAVKKAKIADIPNYTVAGKTGTAAIPDFKKGGYTDELIHTFVGFAPASDPEFTILVKIDKPQVGPLAGFTVVPAFRELAEFILDYYDIPPDDLEERG